MVFRLIYEHINNNVYLSSFVKGAFILWITVVVILYLLLVGPREFWSLAYYSGYWFELNQLKAYLELIFHHRYSIIFR